MRAYIYQKLLRLDCATLVSDSKLKKFIIRKIARPIGYYFRKKNYNLKYK